MFNTLYCGRYYALYLESLSPGRVRGVVRCMFSSEVSTLRPSTVHRVLGTATSPTVVPFTTNGPSITTFPMSSMEHVDTGVFRGRPVATLRCNIARNCRPLEGAITSCVGGGGGVKESFSGLVVASKTARIVSLTAGSLYGFNSVVMYRGPSFVNSLGYFHSCNYGLGNIPIRRSNVSVGTLRGILGRGGGIHFVCAVPGFRGPSNEAVSLRGEGALCTLTGGCNILVLRSGPCNSLHISNRGMPAIGDVSRSNVMVCTNSFSGILTPNVHITCMVTPRPVITGVAIYGRKRSIRATVFGRVLMCR